MRVIAKLPDLVYLAFGGTIYVAGFTGVPGAPVADPQAEVIALRKHGQFLARHGRQQCGDEFDLAADGIEAALRNVYGNPIAA